RTQGWKVRYIRNITDSDDKIIKRATENGETIQQLTTSFIDAMNEDAANLGCAAPHEAPKATEYIDQMEN
ncbi:cysteine--tRNA ligase, partial [Acinetobacter calcoaceticus]